LDTGKNILKLKLSVGSATDVGYWINAVWLIHDGNITRIEAVLLLAVFAGVMGWTIRQGLRKKADALDDEMREELKAHGMPIGKAVFWLGAGLVLLAASSRLLVWGAVEIARSLGASDLIIGLTVVAVGTSLPELGSSIIAARKGEHDIVLGNIIGSNLFNTLAVVGIAGAIHPIKTGPEVFYRDAMIMAALTLSLFIIGYGFRKKMGRINRLEGTVLLICYIGYTAYLIKSLF